MCSTVSVRRAGGRREAAVATVRIGTEQHDALQPRSIGDIVDRSVTLSVRHWRTLFVLVLIEAVPVGFVRVMLPETGRADLLWLPLDILLVALLYPAAILTVTATSTLTAGLALKTAARHYGASLVTFFISAAWTLLWIVLSAAAASLSMMPFIAIRPTAAVVAAAVGGGAVALALLPRAGLIAATMLPIVILERRSPFDAFARARRRVNHAGFVRSSLLGLAVFAVTIAPLLVIGSGVDAIVEMTHLTGLRIVDEVVADGMFLGLGMVLNTVAALDLRARHDGADLEAELDAKARRFTP